MITIDRPFLNLPTHPSSSSTGQMSQVKLYLQPPPNVDFVTGYPGIPPGSERPQAAVKGAIEVRIPPQGVKAKWVRIELRKVETLPGGSANNTFYDFVGPSPVNLWSSPDEYSLLRSTEFPFSIRIPESIPPTVSLDNRAGIGYELVASICTKGKRSFLRKAKSVVVSAISSIMIDKHELHSTWPVYCQPETRHIVHDGVNLSVQRNNTCYGPGDRISVIAILKSDSLHTIILRTLELSLRETTVFRAGILGPGKRSAPQEKQINIAEGKLPVNATLYGGSSHTAELSCMLPPDHTTPTLNAARHIDVTYTLCIRAFLGTGEPILMELPVIISNWQRNVSYEAISRIGLAPSLSLFPAAQNGNPAVPTRGRPADAVAATLPLNRTVFPNPAGNTYKTLPASSNTTRPSEDGAPYAAPRFGNNGFADEFGSTRPTPAVAPVNPVATPIPTSNPNTSTPTRRPNSAGGANRFTVTNPQPPPDLPQSPPSRQRSTNGPGSGPSSGNAQRQWPTAEEEKLQLYENARAKVAQVQGPGATPPPANGQVSPPLQTLSATPPRVAAAAAASPTKTVWMSAEEEKLKLFREAQAAVQRSQEGLGPSTHARNDSDPASRGQPASGSGNKPPSAAAALYAQAVNAQGRQAPGSGSSTSNPTTPPRNNNKPAVPQYLTAEEEKAALRRYEEAKRAVDRTQNSAYDESPTDQTPGSSAPIAYESLFPAPASTSRPGATDEPPPFQSSVIPQSHLSEKERLKRAYEASDAAAARVRQNDVNTSPPSPPPVSPPTHVQYANALEEKEALKKKFEARDNAQANKGTPAPQPPPPRVSNAGADIVNANSAAPETTLSRNPSSNATVFRPTPLPPAAATSRVLSAAEEKALLRAKFEAQDAKANQRNKPAVPVPMNGIHSSGPPVVSTPPPLMPRPPVEYIKETQEEDARVSRLNGEVPVFDISPHSSRRGTPKPQGGGSSFPNASSSFTDASGGGGSKPHSPFGTTTFEGASASGTVPPLPTGE